MNVDLLRKTTTFQGYLYSTLDKVEVSCMPLHLILSTTLCRGITRQVLATVPLRARLNGRPVVAGLPVPTDDLVPVAGGPS